MHSRSTLPTFLEADVQKGKAVEISMTIAGRREEPLGCSPRLAAKIKSLLGEPLLEKPVFKTESIRTTIRSNIGYVTYYHALSSEVVVQIHKAVLAYTRKEWRRSSRAIRVRNAKLAKQGCYLGPNQRVVAPPRISDPGIPSIGDVPRSEWESVELIFWAVSPHAAQGMSQVLPAGTGVALKKLNSSKELIPGAVYVYWVDDLISPIAGRLLPRTRDQVHLHLRYDDEEYHARYGKPGCWVEWKNSTIHICQVVYYTSQPIRNQSPC